MHLSDTWPQNHKHGGPWTALLWPKDPLLGSLLCIKNSPDEQSLRLGLALLLKNASPSTFNSVFLYALSPSLVFIFTNEGVFPLRPVFNLP